METKASKSTLRRLRVQPQAAERKVTAASERCRVLPDGSSRARVTTANAKYATACEARDRALRAVEEAEHAELIARHDAGRTGKDGSK